MSAPTDEAIRAYVADLIRAYAAGLDYLDLAEHMAYDDTIGDVRIADLDGPEIDDMQRRILDAAHVWGANNHAADQLRPEYGIRIDYVSTLREERPVADNLADAQTERDRIAERPDVVSCTVVRWSDGEWHEIGDGRG